MNPDNGAYTGLVDAHCHLQDGFLRHALAPALIRARAAGVTLMCCNGTGEDDWDYVLGLGMRYMNAARVILLGVGGVGSWYSREIGRASCRERV